MNNSLFVLAGQAVYSSSTGSNWTLQALPTSQRYLSRMAYGNGTFFALAVRSSQSEASYTSVDGSDWTLGEPFEHGFRWGDVVFAHDAFVIAGDSGVIYTSTTGSNFVERVPGQFYNDQFSTLTYGNGRVVAVGANGVVIVSDHYGPPLLKISKAGDVRLSVSAEKDKLCVVEQSNHLLNWTEVTRYTNSAESLEIPAFSATNAAMVFRVRTD
jgi:hypothetical protein